MGFARGRSNHHTGRGSGGFFYAHLKIGAVMINTLAQELNTQIEQGNPQLFDSLSEFGKSLYYPKGILTQTAEAKQKAHRHNATIGIAKCKGKPLYLDSVFDFFKGVEPDEIFPYAPSFGLDSLRRKWREKMLLENPSLNNKPLSMPVVTSGITHGLSLAGDLFVNRGDTVILPDKVWGNYLLIYTVRYGARIARYTLLNSYGGLDMCSFRQTVLEEARRGKIIVILNFPNNPTGYAPTASEAQTISVILQEAATSCDVVAVCDDSYFGLFYDSACCRESVFGFLAGSHPRLTAVKLDGATKEDFAWGFRTGFITFSALSKQGEILSCLEKKCAGAIRCGISNCPLPSQSILLKAMERPEFEGQRMKARDVLRERALEVRRILASEKYTPFWEPYPFNAGYFMCIRLKELDAEKFRLRLLEQYGVGVIATSNTDIRIAFSCVEAEKLEDLFDIMLRCAVEMRSEAAAGGTVHP